MSCVCERSAPEDTEMTEEDIAQSLAAADDIEVAELDAMGLKKLLLSLEKKISKNMKMRMDFHDVPAK